MADLFTHMATGLLFKAGTGGKHTGALVLGTVLPDLMRSVPVMGLDKLIRFGIVDLPIETLYPWVMLHTPFGILLSCILIAWLFVERERYEIFKWLMIGCGFHLGLDLCQYHHGEGYFLFVPFSTETVDIGFMGTETTVVWAPWLMGLSVLAWGVRYWFERNMSRASGR